MMKQEFDVRENNKNKKPQVYLDSMKLSDMQLVAYLYRLEPAQLPFDSIDEMLELTDQEMYRNRLSEEIKHLVHFIKHLYNVAETSLEQLNRDMLDDIVGERIPRDIETKKLISRDPLVKRISRPGAVNLVFIYELYARFIDPTYRKKIKKELEKTDKIRNAYDIYEEFKNMRYLNIEQIKIILINGKNEIEDTISYQNNFRNQATLQPEEMNHIINQYPNIKGIAFVHNHPSGDPTPSESDYEFTNIHLRNFHEKEIDFIDHVIIGGNLFWSLADSFKKAT
ncbi:MAG: JAB domain-containing protein [Bacillota bacterium]